MPKKDEDTESHKIVELYEFLKDLSRDFERSTVQRIEDNSNDMSCSLYTIMQMNTHKYGHGKTRNKKLLREDTILRKDGSSAVFNIDLEIGRGKQREKKQIITTRGIRIWSPIQALTPPNRA